jgi:hypothetical protein
LYSDSFNITELEVWAVEKKHYCIYDSMPSGSFAKEDDALLRFDSYHLES